MTDVADLKFVNIYRSGAKRYAYFRSPQTGRVRLPDPDGDIGAFHVAYGAALQLRDRLAKGGTAQDPDSFAGLVDRYLRSVEFRALADPTQHDYSKICTLVVDQLGDVPYRFTTRSMIKTARDDYAATTRKANKFTAMVSIIYGWAQQADLVPDGFNPASGIRKLKRKGGEREITPWSDAEVAWVLAAAPSHVATPILIALYTGQRREDVVTMTWQQVQGDMLRVRTSKTRQLIDLPCHPDLAAHLDKLRKQSKVVSLTGAICLTESGVPYATANALSGAVRRVVEKVDQVPNNRSMHGLRYAAAARMEEGGATVAAIEAVLGHRTFRMALKYASARMRAREGVAAMKGSNDG